MPVWQLGPDRAAEWRTIRLESLREAPDAFEERLADWAERPLEDFARRLVSGRTFAAGDEPGRPLAVAGWVSGLDARDAARGWVVSVYARPEARGTGLAGAALQAVFGDASACGMTSLGLNVVASNLPALALYEGLGFRDSGRTGIVTSRGAPEIEMLRPLP